MSIEDEVCGVCKTPYNATGVLCDVCQSNIGFPNVRAAKRSEHGLQSRYEKELASINTRGIEDVADKFKNTVDSGSVVIARSMLDTLPLILNNHKLITTFHHQVASSARLAESNEYDKKREHIESMLHPFYYQDIHYGALSLDCIGISSYGEVHIQFHDEMIKHRTSFFHENPFDFVKKHKLIVGESIPIGYSSTWEGKGVLALCKCHFNLNTKEQSIHDFQKLLVVDREENPDFLEAHIYGTIHVNSIKKLTIFDNVSKATEVLFNTHKDRFNALNIDVEIRKK